MEFIGEHRDLCQSKELNTWSVILYDVWSETEYRADQFWRGHEFHRPWLFAPRRTYPGYVPEWPGRGLHSGHAPINFPMVGGFAPAESYYFLHLAYKTAKLRRNKRDQYMSKKELLSPFELAHASSITDYDS